MSFSGKQPPLVHDKVFKISGLKRGRGRLKNLSSGCLRLFFKQCKVVAYGRKLLKRSACSLRELTVFGLHSQHDRVREGRGTGFLAR